LTAVIGRAFSFEVLMEASDGDEEMLVRGLDELRQHRIIREQGRDAYDFSHDKFREVIYGELSEARRRMLHRRVARALESVYDQNLDLVAAQVAAHYERAYELQEARVFYERAAEMAEDMHLEEDAARCRRWASALSQGGAADPPPVPGAGSA
jgi:predicted ATPase